nr:hypothetical protein [Marinobacterium profundum]
MILSSDDSIRIEIPRPGGNLVVNWPVTQADRCQLWLQEPLRLSVLMRPGAASVWS